jgi:hypothetical protein
VPRPDSFNPAAVGRPYAGANAKRKPNKEFLSADQTGSSQIIEKDEVLESVIPLLSRLICG